jgi:hypothetical protein
MNNKKKHLLTIRKHRKEVLKACFKMGIPLQGILHDLSKYSKEEMSICKWYTGTKSPHAVCREKIGYSPSWPHHYHKNKHHWQYWLDIEDWPDKVYAIKMPYKYVIEMFCDFVGAGKAYLGDKWTLQSPYEYFLDFCKGKRLMHSDSESLLECLLVEMSDLHHSEKEFYEWYKKNKKELIDDYYEGDE